jgi:hypothetical protein
MPEPLATSTAAHAAGSPSGTDKARNAIPRVWNEPTFGTLCVIVRSVIEHDPELGLNGADQGDLEEATKVVCARARLAYSSSSVRKACDAVLSANRRARSHWGRS